MTPQASLGMRSLVVALALASTPTLASEETGTVVGKNDWLFFRWERIDPSYRETVNTFADMLGKTSSLFAANGVQVVLTITPLKMQLYPDHLPANFQLAPGMANNYANMLARLQRSGASPADQLTAFMAHASNPSNPPLYLRLDSHWTPDGARLAAETIVRHIDATPLLADVWRSIPEVPYTLTQLPTPVQSLTTDLLPTLPPGATPPPPEMITSYRVERAGPANEYDLDSNAAIPQVTVIGSSFTDRNTLFPDFVRYALQSDLLDISIPGRQGPWVGIEDYVSSVEFQRHPPKLLIWEVPERDSPNPPDSPWRDAIYKRDNVEWLRTVATAISRQCNASPVSVKINAPQLPGIAAADGTRIDSTSSQHDSYVEFEFTQPLDQLDFLRFNFSLLGTGSVRFEADAGKGAHSWTAKVPDTGEAMLVKTIVPKAAQGASRLKLYPGEGSALSIDQATICRHNTDLLAGVKGQP